MSPPAEYIKDVFVVNRWILRFAGLWVPDNRAKSIQFLYKCYAIFVFLFVNLYFTATEFLSLFYTYKHLFSFIKNINFFLTHFMGAVKVTFWFFKGHVLRNLMDTLESEEFYYANCEACRFYPGAIWRKYRKIGFKYTLGFLMLAHMTLSSSYVPPLITVTLHPPSGNGSMGFYKRLPYYSWMPFNHFTPRSYLLALGYQAGPMFSYAYSIVGMDSLFMNIMNFIAAHLTILQGAFQSNKERMIEEISNNNLISNEKIRQKMNDEMKKNSQHLQVILRYYKFKKNKK